MRFPLLYGWAQPNRLPIASTPVQWLFFALTAVAATPIATLSGWDLQSSPVSADLYDVTANHGNIDMAWACGAEGTILFTSNGGATWVRQESGTTNDLYGIVFYEIAGGPVVAAGAGGTILRTTNQGATWTPLASGTTETLRCASDFGMLIVGDHGTILKGNNLGTIWSPMNSGTTANLFSVSGSFSTYAVGEGGTILAHNLSLGWFPRESGTTADLFGTPLFGAANFITGDGGLILRSSNGGVGWAPQAVGTTAALRAIEFSGNTTTHLYAVGDMGVIVKTTDQGTTWGFQQGTAENLHGVFFYLNDDRGWAVGENATILRTNDGGGPVVLGVSPSAASASELRIGSYPNPFHTRATLVFQLDRPGRIVLDLFDPAGRRIGGWRDEAASEGEQRIMLDVAPELPATVIFARLTTPTGTGVSRLLHIP